MNEREIFAQAIELDATADRSAFLDEVCGRDGPLRSRIERLLQAHENPLSVLDRPVVCWDLTNSIGETADDSQASSVAEGKDPTLQTEWEKPRRLGQFELRRLLGQGGMGMVFEAYDPHLDRLVATKILAPHFAAKLCARQRFLREARAAAAVNHPHVASIHAVGEDKATPFLVMELVDGPSLQEHLETQGALEVLEIVRIAAQVAAGLAAAHRQGLVHRDIKPANILLEQGLQCAKITDFGLARAVDDVRITQSGEVSGTPLYMSPEQVRGQEVDHRSDLFSLGCVMYAMCTGAPPFLADSTVAVLAQVCWATPGSIRATNPAIPAWLEAIVNRLLVKDPASRFPSAAELGRCLEQCLASLQHAGAANAPPTPEALVSRLTNAPPRSAIFRWAALGTSLAVLLTAVALGIFAATGLSDLSDRLGAITSWPSVTKSVASRKNGSPLDSSPTRETPRWADARRLTDAGPPQDSQPTRDSQHELAKWVLGLGGKIALAEGRGSGMDIDRLSDLPDEEIELSWISLEGSRVLSNADLQRFQGLSQLDMLNLSGTTIGDPGVARLKDLPKLVYLNLVDTLVTDDGLVTLKRHPQLSQLYLSRCGITDRAMPLLGEMPLTELAVDGTAVTFAGLQHLAGHPALRKLIVRHLNLTEEEIGRLAKLLPGCELTTDSGTICH